MKVKKSFEEINAKILKGEAVVMTAEEVSAMSKDYSAADIVKKVDIVTTATFGPMCSSGMFMNVGHSNPPIRMERVTLNNVPAHSGIAAVDLYVGATEENPFDEKYGGAHVIEALIAGKDVRLKASAKGTDCYPETEIETIINKSVVNEMIMFNPRNAYQNYPCAVNTSGRMIYTYMGSLLPNVGNATFSTSGELSPLLNDPDMRTIGIGTRLFLCGAQGYVSWYGTQFKTSGPKNEYGIPETNAATLAVIGNAKEMSTDYLKAAYFEKYGVSIFIGIGIPVPVLDEDMAHRVSIRNDQITTTVCDYSKADHPAVAKVRYDELFSGNITLDGKKVRTASMSSVAKARIIAAELKKWIEAKSFQLTRPVEAFPTATTLNSLERK
ncbi:MAG TPA: homocysteine biosynthesis protein [Bacteroidales bacterium]|nr:homocysteine biosynthesis protein [Bacteroidales bacterium]